MLAGLFVLMAFAVAAVVAVACVVGLLLHLAVGLVLLPFRLLGWILFLPLLIVKTLIGVVVGVVGLVFLVPFVLLTIVGALLAAALAIVGTVIGVVVVPLLPLVAIGAVIWLLVKASARPAAI